MIVVHFLAFFLALTTQAKDVLDCLQPSAECHEALPEGQAVSLLQTHIHLKGAPSQSLLEVWRFDSQHHTMQLLQEGTMQAQKRKSKDVVISEKSIAATAFLYAASVFIIVLFLRQIFPAAVPGFAYSSMYIAISASLINWNKFLMEDGPFPYAMPLTTLHMTVTWLGLFSLYCFKPALFPSMASIEHGPRIFGIAPKLYWYFMPLGLFYAISLYLSNIAYRYCSVSFLQMMKESTLVLVFLLSVLVGMQQFSRARVLVIVWILTGAVMCVTGEIEFALFGFIIQVVSQWAEAGKNVLGEWMMTASASRLDALTYTMSLAPMTLIPLLIGTITTFEPKIAADFLANWPMLLCNASLAVSLNVVVSMVIKNCSAVAFALAGLAKDIFIILLSSVLYADIITRQQMVGFLVTLSGIAAWTSIKLRPHYWEWLSAPPSKDIPSKEGAAGF